MAKLKVGERVDTLICVEENIKSDSRKVGMKCNLCGYYGEYDGYSVQKSSKPCRLCSHFGKYTIEHIENGKKVPAYIENNNMVIGWVYTKEGEDAYKYPKNTVRFKCLTCGNVFDITLKDLRSWGEVKCSRCKNLKRNNNIKNKSVEPVKIKSSQEVFNKDTNTKSKVDMPKKDVYNNSYLTNKNLKIEDKKDELVGKKYGTLEVISVYYTIDKNNIRKPSNRIKCRCTICGMEDEYDKYKVKKDSTCKICKQMDTKLYKGKNEQVRDMVGTVVNRLKILKQTQNENGAWIGEYQCLSCKTKNKAALVKLSNKEVYCSKCMELGAKPVSMECPECGHRMNILYKTLYTSSIKQRCPRCKSLIDLTVERSLIDDSNTFRNVLGKYSKMGLGLTDIQTDTRLAKFGSVFINRKGERCYNCYCIEHRQELVLSESEIEEFNHKQCNCDNVEFYKLLNIPTKIKKKERSVDDILGSK